MPSPRDPLAWQRAREVFDIVAGLPPSERAARLAELCGGDDALQTEVASLLEHDRPAGDILTAIVRAGATEAAAGADGLHVGGVLLHYGVTAEVGRGAMGVVWKATDLTLGRDVAIKVLPPVLSRDPSRLDRFEREARALAALNHPNIAAIYSVHEADGLRFLAMEFVDGDDLTRRMADGPMAVPEVLAIARQIADGLEEAHEKGIVHRDLKPANVKVTPSGKVKVLDFGLAKALASDAAARASGSDQDRDDVSALATRAGLLVGTAAYMAPEQARGAPIDRRADIWSFGVVLFEMLAGRRPFAGATLTDVLAAVTTTEPDWTLLPAGTPRPLEQLIRRCLDKDQRQRLRDIGDARVELERLSGATPDSATADAGPAPEPSRPILTGITTAIVGAGVAALATWAAVRPAPAPPSTVDRLTVALPAGLRIDDAPDASRQQLALTRDGRVMAFVTRDAGGRKQIYLRRTDRVDAEPVAGADGADMPFFSPDGQHLGFASDGKLKRVALAGSEPVVLCDAPAPRGAAWGDDGTIVFAPGAFGGLARVPATGGTPVPLTTLTDGEESHRWPSILPGGRAVLFGVLPAGRDEQQAPIAAVRLDTGARQPLLNGGVFPRFVSGHVVFTSASGLMAAPFDPGRLVVTGPAAPVLDDVRRDLLPARRVSFDVAASGALLYVPGAVRQAEREIVWLERSGSATAAVDEKRPYKGVQLSPDGQSLAVLIEGAPVTSLWNYSLTRGTWQRLTFDQDVSTPAWTPDGSRLIYSSDSERATYAVTTHGGGAPQRLTPPSREGGDMPAVAPDGRTALIAVQGGRGDDIVALTLDDRQAITPFQAGAGNDVSPAFSPDGRFVAYSSTESGRREVYIRPFDGPARKWPVSTDGGGVPRWRRDGRELFYLAGARMMAVPVTPAAGGLTIGTAVRLFDDPSLAWSDSDGHRYDVSADGRRFITVRPDPREVRPLPLVAIPQFGREMAERLAGRR